MTDRFLSSDLPLLSIIVPVYNVERYIADCLNSLTDQGFSDGECEIICVDDESTDSSVAILEAFRARHGAIRIVKKSNGGVSSARNEGFRVSRGRFVTFCDSDDYLQSNYLRSLILLMIKHGSNSLLYPNLNVVPDSSKFTRMPSSRHIDYEVARSRGREVARSHQNAFVWILERDVVESFAPPFSENLSYGEDTLFGYVASLHVDAARQIIVKNRVYNYRRRPGSATTALNITLHRNDMLVMARTYRSYVERLMAADSPNDFAIKAVRRRQHLAVAAAINDAVFSKVEIAPFISGLKAEGLYPYPILWYWLLPDRSLKRTLWRWVAFIYPIEGLLKPYGWVIRRIVQP